MFLIILTFLFGYVIYKWISIRPSNFPPGPPCVPFAGSAPFIPKKHIHFTLEKWRYKYGPVVGLLLGPVPAIAVVDPHAVLDVLKREEFLGRPLNDIMKKRSFNKRLGIVFNEGPSWVEQRRFTLRHLKEFGFGKTSMESLILHEIDELLSDVKDRTLQINGLFSLSTVNMLWHLIAGTRYQRNDPELVELLNNLVELFRSGNPAGMILLNMFPFLKYIAPNLVGGKLLSTNKKMQDFMYNIIQEHKATIDANNPRDFIDVYLAEIETHDDQGSSFSEEGLIVLCMDLFTGGAESVSNTIGFLILYMVLYPEIQLKVQAEVDCYIGPNRKPSLEDRARLPYVEAVLLEVQRINPIGPLTIPRRVLKDTELYGYNIPKDTLVLNSLWSLLHDKEHWKDPENFRPARFLNEEGNVIQDKWFLPFSHGKRVCPGEALSRNTLFLFFTCLLQKFNIVLPPGDPKPSTLPLPGFTMSPQNFEVKFVSR